MDSKVSLSDVLSLSASGAYGGGRQLSADTEAAIRCFGVVLSNLNHWQGSGIDFTENEVDQIAAIVASLQYEVSNEVLVSSYQHIKTLNYDTDAAVIDSGDIDPLDYNALKIFISGVVSNTTVRWAEDTKLVLNEQTSATLYYSLGRLETLGGHLTANNMATIGGLLLPYSCLGTYLGGVVNVFSNYEITLWNASSDDMYKQFAYTGSIPGINPARMGHAVGSGMCYILNPITRLQLYPVTGTLFNVAGSGSEPPQLRMSIYGVNNG